MTQVAELINPTTGVWDVELVEEVFWEEDAETIRALPVHEGCENFLAWHFDDHGRFSVKSAYKVCRADFLWQQNRAGAQGSSGAGPDPIWRTIWKLKCPGKIKHFFWRLPHNSQPLRSNLVQRGMNIGINCLVCGHNGEDGGHLFFKCRLAKAIWSHLCLEKERLELADIVHVSDVVESILKAKEDKRLLMIIAMWFIWCERNIIREEGRRRSADFVTRCIRSYAEENTEVLGGNRQTISTRSRQLEKWSKPPAGVLKMNCDASFLPNSSSGSWGFLIRDGEGDVIVTGRGKVDHLLNAFHAELVACLQGIQTAVDLGIGHLIVETDAKMVAQAVSTNDFDDAAMGLLVSEIKNLVSSCFISFECVFKSWECNQAAHELAKLGLLCNQGEEQIMSSIPKSIHVFVANCHVSKKLSWQDNKCI